MEILNQNSFEGLKIKKQYFHDCVARVGLCVRNEMIIM